MARKKVNHDPAVILAKVVSTVMTLPTISWDAYPENKDAPAFLRNLDGEEYIFVQKEALRAIIEEFGQLNMNKVILSNALVQEGCRNTPCLQVKAKNSQVRILVYAFKLGKLQALEM
jgi:homogentisate 1,2-dioxygenase